MGNFTPAGIEYLVKNFSKGMSNLGKLDKAQQGLGKSATSTSKQFTGLGKGVLSVGALAGGAAVAGVTALGAGVATLGVVSVKTAISFESAFAGVLKTTDGLTDSMGDLNIAGRELREGFVDLSKEVPLAFEELARIGELGGQLGIGKDALIEFTESVAALGVSTNLSTEEAASGLARMSNIFNVSSEDMGGNITRLGSSIVDLGNNFATTERDILAFAERLAGAGSIAGLTQADVLGIGAAMSSVGVQAEAGGTAVQKVLLAINSAVVGSTEGFVDNTEAIEENVNRLTSLNGKLVALEAKAGLTGDQILQMRDEFIAAGGSAEEFGRQLGATERRQLFETALAVRDLTDETALLREMQGQPIDAGQLETFARTAGMSADEFKEAWETDASSAFQLFVEGLGKQGDDAINTLEELGLTDQRLIRAFLSLAGAGDLLGDTLETANTAFDENTALADEAAKRYATTESQMLILKNTLRAIGDAIGSRLLPFVNKLITAGKKLIDKWADPIARALDEKIIPALDSVIKIIESLFGALSGEGNIDTFLNFAQALSNLGFDPEVVTSLSLAFDSLMNTITRLQEAFQAGGLQQLMNELGTVLLEGWNTFVQPVIDSWIESATQWITDAIVTLPEKLTGFIGSITSFLTEEGPTIQTSTDSWIDAIWAWVETAVTQVGTVLGALLVSIAAWATSSEAQIALSEMGSALGQLLFDGLLLMLENQEKIAGILIKMAIGILAGVGAVTGILILAGGQMVAGMISGMLEKLGLDVEPALITELTSILSGIADNILTIAEETLGKPIVDGLIAGLLGGVQPLIDALIVLMDDGIEGLKVHLGISSPSTVFMEFGVSIVQGLIDGILSMAGSLTETLGGLFSGLLGGDGGGMAPVDISPEGIEVASSAAKVLSDLLTTINNQISVLLPESLIVFQEQFTLTFQQVIDIVTQVDLLLIKIATVTFPQLMAAARLATQTMIVGFQQVNAVLIQTDLLLLKIADSLIIIAAKAKEAAEAMEKGFKEAASVIKNKLIPALTEAIKKLERLEERAERAAHAISQITGTQKAGAEARAGMGFQGGTGALGFLVPPGFPNDTFPINVTSGERILVSPPGRSIESMISQRVNMQPVPAVQIGVVNINNDMDVGTLTQIIKRTVTGRM